MKTALITGANRGIGFETAKQLSEQNWNLIATSRHDPFPSEAKVALTQINPHTQFLPLDTSDKTSIQRAANKLDQSGTTLDLLINNAGILLDWHDSILDVHIETIHQTLTTNTLGPLLVTRALRPLLKRATSPLIINISSAAGSLGEMRDWAPAYSLSKSALNAISQQCAAALKADGIAVCSLSPGWVQTDMGGPNATRSVEDAARSIIKLLDKEPSALNGRFLRDGEDLPW